VSGGSARTTMGGDGKRSRAAPAACGATAMRRRHRPCTASPEATPYIRRYHDQEQVNEDGHGGSLPGRCGTGRGTGRAAADLNVSYFDLKSRVAVRDRGRCCRQDGLDPLG
jgi:hypothetical protein